MWDACCHPGEDAKLASDCRRLELREEVKVREMDVGVTGMWYSKSGEWRRREENLTELGALGQEEIRYRRWF